jgi:hypothetical protein
MTDAEYRAFVRLAERETRQREKAERRAKRRR